MPAGLTSIVHAAVGKRVLLVGDLILDRYIYGDAERISPEAPVPVLRVVERSDAVGGAGSVAACLKSLGVEPVVCGVVGQDPNGQRLISLLTTSGADCQGVLEVAGRPTTTKTRLIGLAQHRHRQQLIRVDEESVDQLDGSDSQRMLQLATSAVTSCDAVCIEDYEKGVVSPELVSALVKAASTNGKPVLVDPGRLSDYSRYRGATLLTPNRNELALATGTQRMKHEEIAADAEKTATINRSPSNSSNARPRGRTARARSMRLATHPDARQKRI